MGSITIEFQLNEKEHFLAWKIRQKGSGARYWIDRSLAGALFIGGAMTIGMYGTKWWNIAMLFGSVVFFLIIALSPIILRRQFRADSRFRATQQLIFSDSGIEYKTADVSSALSWSFYSGMIEADGLILLLYSKYQHSIIPKRSFTSDSDLKDFLALANRKIVVS